MIYNRLSVTENTETAIDFSVTFASPWCIASWRWASLRSTHAPAATGRVRGRRRSSPLPIVPSPPPAEGLARPPAPPGRAGRHREHLCQARSSLSEVARGWVAYNLSLDQPRGGL